MNDSVDNPLRVMVPIRKTGKLHMLHPNYAGVSRVFHFLNSDPETTFRFRYWKYHRYVSMKGKCLEDFIAKTARKSYMFTRKSGEDFWEVQSPAQVYAEWEQE